MPTSHWLISFVNPYEGEKDPNKQTTTTKKSETHMLTLIMSFIESAAMANGESVGLTVTGKPHHQIPRKCVYTPPACPRNSMALLEPSCSPGNGFPSQQCGNCLLKQKDIASLGVIKPIKKTHLGLIYALQNHMIDILWSAVSQTLGKARPAISSTSQ